MREICTSEALTPKICSVSLDGLECHKTIEIIGNHFDHNLRCRVVNDTVALICEDCGLVGVRWTKPQSYTAYVASKLRDTDFLSESENASMAALYAASLRKQFDIEAIAPQWELFGVVSEQGGNRGEILNFDMEILKRCDEVFVNMDDIGVSSGVTAEMTQSIQDNKKLSLFKHFWAKDCSSCITLYPLSTCSQKHALSVR